MSQSDPPIRPGSIVWAEIADRKGQNEKERPLLIIPPAPNGPGAVFSCLAISTDPTHDESDPALELPWSADDGSTTGLWQYSRAVLLWYTQLAPSQITRHTGRITRSNLDEILTARDLARSFKAKPRR